MDRRTFVGGASAALAAAQLARASTFAFGGEQGGDASPRGEGELVAMPATVSGVAVPVVCLNGEWECSGKPEKEFWKPTSATRWSKIEVPGEFALQGFPVADGVEYPCRRSVTIPADFASHRIFLRFDGVYSYARVWVNGNFVRDHQGGFTSWDCEITSLVTPGQTAELTVGITDHRNDISQETYYAHHSILGILRDVRVFALPANGISTLSAVARVSDNFRTGFIDIAADIALPAKPVELELHLTDGAGKRIPMSLTRFPLDGAALHSASVKVPTLWDAEHPHLYELEVEVLVDGSAVQTHRVELGFRSIKVLGNELLVNGRPVKLRGVCRHSIHPIYGRAVPAEFDEKDARLFRAANINFIRTSHYPPSEQFLRACDKHGIYLEEETAVSWSNLNDGPSSDPSFTNNFVDQFREMVQRDQHHACVLLWSLGNESQWGDNFTAERLYVQEADPLRPLIFSYPDTIPWKVPRCDIYSKHYAEWNSNLGGSVSPVLHDEFAHVSCYNVETYHRDPGVRNFWGHSIAKFCDSFLATDGCLGGSIWAGIDELFLLPDKPVGYGPWGIIDGWRREKPEYWLTKKAYSPIRLRDAELPQPPRETVLSVAVRNAFDHTNLRELEIVWSTAHGNGKLRGVDIEPGGTGYLEIPTQSWAMGDVLDLQFVRADGLLIDHFKLPIGARPAIQKTSATATVEVDEMELDIIVRVGKMSVRFSRETGLIAEASVAGEKVIESGPFLDLGNGYFKGWILRSIDIRKSNDRVTILSSGESRFTDGIVKIKVDFEFEVDSTGLLTTRYRITGNMPKASHLGIAYLISAHAETLTWDRKSQWSVYPADHIGRGTGTALRKPDHPLPTYRVQPAWPWSQDTGDPYDTQTTTPHPETRDFCAIKENIRSASLMLEGGRASLSVEGDADIAARAASLPDGRVAFSVFNFWSYPDLVWGNYVGPVDLPAQTVREVKLRLSITDTGLKQKA